MERERRSLLFEFYLKNSIAVLCIVLHEEVFVFFIVEFFWFL